LRYDYSNHNRNKYLYDKIDLSVKAEEWTKDSGKESLQYAVGGLLYMPASNTKIASKIISGEYSFIKSMVLDLEDSLGDDLVGYGQRAIVNTIAEIAEAVENGKLQYADIPLIFIRAREYCQMIRTLEILGVNMRYISGFNVPKFSQHNCTDYIEEFMYVNDSVREITSGTCSLYMMPIIEDKDAMYRQKRMENLLKINDSLRTIESNVLNIRVGGADFCSVFGIRRSINDDIYDIGVVRSALNDIVNVFGKSYIVSGPVWEYFENKDNPSDTRWSKGLQKELYADRLNGFIGKTCIHPSQCIFIQQSLIVDKTDYEDAMNILGMNANTTGVKKSAGGNRMNEVKTHTNWAKKTVGLAKMYGVKEI
jgi:putative ATP/GTP-binding protein